MNSFKHNPFNITKAVDLTDKEILELWVDLPIGSGNSLFNFIKPKSSMPMFIIGGKGSGKTHLIRYISYPIRKLGYNKGLEKGVIDDGFIGIYIRCGGLNASRFSGKGISEDRWSTIFAYYIELWIARQLVDNIYEIIQAALDQEKEFLFCNKFSELFDRKPKVKLTSFSEIIECLTNLQKELDFAVNNCVFTGDEFPEVLLTRGNLIFEIPNIFHSIYFPENSIIFQYLLDEFENFTESQQIYINTLIRERRGLCSFKIGSRLFGIRTLKTLSADEENKQGSEFEKAELDKHYRESSFFIDFARNLINTRIAAIGNYADSPDAKTCLLKFKEQSNHLFDDDSSTLIDKKPLNERAYYKKFIKNVSNNFSDSIISKIDTLLAEAQYPLLHKLCIHYIYTCISKDDEVDFDSILTDIKTTLTDLKLTGLVESYLSHFRNDYLAQLYKEYHLPLNYGGLDGIIDLCMGNPRHLLIILKYIYDWALYKNDLDSLTNEISFESQNSGILDAANWFYSDAKLIGSDGDHVQNSIGRLCELFREIRYSDKPAECSLCTFSIDLGAVSDRTRKILEIAEKWSLIINVGTHSTKSTGTKNYKYQINKLLAPRWELATARRGTLQLNPQEADSIFDENFISSFNVNKAYRLSRLNYPFKKAKRKETMGDQNNQLSLL